MTLNIELPEAKTAVLAAKARDQGLSAEQYVCRVIERDLESGAISKGDNEADVEYRSWPLGVRGEITRKDIYDQL